MDWQKYKENYLQELLKDIAQLSVKVENKELTDWSLKKELTLTQNRIGLFIDKIDTELLKKENAKQESLIEQEI